MKSLREIAYKTFLDTLNGNLLNNSLEKFVYSTNVSNEDYSFIVCLCKGTFEYKIAIDDILNKYLKKQTKKPVKAILEMALFELLCMNNSKEYAVVNEYVNIIKRSKYKLSYNFVNAILRNIIRNNEKILSKRLPDWLEKLIINDYDNDTLECLLNYKSIGTTFRVIDKEVIKIIENKYEFNYSEIVDNCINITGINNLKEFDLLVDGKLIVQDSASIKVGNVAKELLNKENNPLILDLCSAPGSKTIHISEIKNSKVLACDISLDRLKKLEENKKRYNKHNIDIIQNDATKYNENFFEKFNLVLCDLPCSGIGLINKKPDILYRLDEKDIFSLSDLQRKILSNAIKYVKKGGYLIFSTCTLAKSENIENFQYLCENLKNIKIDNKSYLQFIQGYDNCDGFFISAFKYE